MINRTFHSQKKSYMVWYFIDVYIINRTLHGNLEIQNFSSRVEKMFEIFFNTGREIFDLPLGHVISSMYVPQNNNYLGIAFPGMSILNGDLARDMPFLKKSICSPVFCLSLCFLKAQPCLCFT